MGKLAGKLFRRMAFLLVVMPTLAPAASSRDADDPVSSAFAAYTHQKWGRERDAPKQIYSVAQGRDGYLWLASAEGLYRFDGVRFERLSPPLPDQGAPSAVLVRRNGDVWVSFAGSHRFAVYRNGRLEMLPPSPVTHRMLVMKEGPDGSVWALSDAEDDPLFRFMDGRWIIYGRRNGIPSGNPFDIVITDAGVVWLSHDDMIFRSDAAASHFTLFRKHEATLSRLAIDRQGRVWLSDQNGSRPITGEKGQGAPPRLRFAYATDRPQINGYTMFDRAGNFWMATEYRGVQRISRPDPRGAASAAEASVAIERFTTQNGLTSNITNRPFQDMEGNIWVGTEKGIDRFRRGSVVSEPKLDDPHVFGDQLLATRDGSVFIVEARNIYRVAPGGRPERILSSDARPSAICEAPNGDMWIMLFRDVLLWRDGRIVGHRPRLPTDITVYDCAFDARGDYWVSVARGGLFRLRGNRWEKMFGETDPDFRPRSMIADPQGTITVQWSYRAMRHMLPNGPQEVRIPFRMQDPQPVTLYAAPSRPGGATLYVGGPVGVARWVGGVWQWLGKDRVSELTDVNGIVVTPGGDHWFAGSAGIVRIAARDAEAAFTNAGHRPSVERFDEDSGLTSMPHDHSRRSIVQGGDGRIWISTQAGTVWIDPARLTRNPFPPKLSIRGVRVGQRFYRDPRHVRLPAGQGDLEIDFAVLSLSNPDRTQVQYRMEGQDQDWISSGHRREAFYTNLAPGTYRFTVIAANEDGVANRKGASVEIEIAATFVQSIWFRAGLVVVAALIVWLLLVLRSAQVAARMRNRLEQRLMERETVARDLHDTLLQGVQGLMLRIQAVANRLRAESPERRSLDEALDRADDLVLKGRNSLRDIRARDSAADLRRTLQGSVDDALIGGAVDVRITELGPGRVIHPLALAEIRAIVDEALFNIGRHADAGMVEIVVSYGRRTFRLRVRDNGRGIPPEVLDSGHREGHFGLVGMRERARTIGGTLKVASPKDAGTEVLLEIPGAVAYERQARLGWWWRS